MDPFHKIQTKLWICKFAAAQLHNCTHSISVTYKRHMYRPGKSGNPPETAITHTGPLCCSAPKSRSSAKHHGSQLQAGYVGEEGMAMWATACGPNLPSDPKPYLQHFGDCPRQSRSRQMRQMAVTIKWEVGFCL